MLPGNKWEKLLFGRCEIGFSGLSDGILFVGAQRCCAQRIGARRAPLRALWGVSLRGGVTIEAVSRQLKGGLLRRFAARNDIATTFLG